MAPLSRIEWEQSFVSRFDVGVLADAHENSGLGIRGQWESKDGKFAETFKSVCVCVCVCVSKHWYAHFKI